jgi:hypothetical protein
MRIEQFISLNSKSQDGTNERIDETTYFDD